MKKIVLLMAGVLICSIVNAELMIAGWHNTVNTNNAAADVTAANISGSVALTGWGLYDKGSDDGDYGSFTGAVAPESIDVSTGGYISRINAAYMDFTITNNGTSASDLSYFRFDAFRTYSGGISNFVLSVHSGDMTVGVVSGGAFTPHNANPDGSDDYEDFDIDLSGLTDHMLAAEESVTFRLQMEDVRDTAKVIFIDNVAVTGATVPEPASVSLLILGAAGSLLFRRSFCCR